VVPPNLQSAYWFIFKSDQLLVIGDQRNILPVDQSHYQLLSASLIREHRLAKLESCDIYCAEYPSDLPLPEGLQSLSLRSALELLEPDWYALAAKAYAIITWDKNHQYCGRCGDLTTTSHHLFERVCPTCSLTFYPRISPSIIVLIYRGDEILMARGPHFPPGSYGLIAGFVEAGETIEDAVHREVSEEVALSIKNLRYFGSQAWPFPDSLMIAFTAEYAAGDLNINPLEIEDAGWYPVNNLPKRTASNISIARKLIDQYVAEHQQSALK
jgi:NAD+ diphosphatase